MWRALVETGGYKKATFVGEDGLLLSGKDSNPHRRNQNPKCYHYTTGQALFLFCDCKVAILFLYSYSMRRKKMVV